MNSQDETITIPKPKKKVKLFVVLGIVMALLVVTALVSYKIFIPYDIKVNSDTVSTTSGEVILLDYEIEPKSAISRVSYEISDTNVVTINANGELEAKSLGSCNVVVKTINGLKREFTVYVHFPSDAFKNRVLRQVIASRGYLGPYESEDDALYDLYTNDDFLAYYFTFDVDDFVGLSFTRYFPSYSIVSTNERYYLNGWLFALNSSADAIDSYEGNLTDSKRSVRDEEIIEIDFENADYRCLLVNSPELYGGVFVSDSVLFKVFVHRLDEQNTIPQVGLDEVDDILTELGLPNPSDYFN